MSGLPGAPTLDGAAGSALLLMRLGDVRLAMPLHTVREVVSLATIARVPWSPAWLRGALYRRGVLFPVADLSHLLGLPRPTAAPGLGVLLDHPEVPLALAAHEVSAADRARTVTTNGVRLTVALPQVVVETLLDPLGEIHELSTDALVSALLGANGAAAG